MRLKGNPLFCLGLRMLREKCIVPAWNFIQQHPFTMIPLIILTALISVFIVTQWCLPRCKCCASTTSALPPSSSSSEEEPTNNAAAVTNTNSETAAATSVTNASNDARLSQQNPQSRQGRELVLAHRNATAPKNPTSMTAQTSTMADILHFIPNTSKANDTTIMYMYSEER
jgi:hypothetical protein